MPALLLQLCVVHLVLHSFPTRRSSDLFSTARPFSRCCSSVMVEKFAPQFPSLNPYPALMSMACPVMASDSGEHRNSAGYGFRDRKSTRLNSSHLGISYAVFCLKKNIQD